MRTPVITGDPIELTYNPKHTGATFDKHSGKARTEKRQDGELGTDGRDDIDKEEEKKAEDGHVNGAHANSVKFQTHKIE